MSNPKVIVKKIPIEDIVPYWRNPRNNELAIEKVKRSIEEYGYQNPIIVDKNNTIIAGHTRYKALQLLDYKEVDCIVADMPEKKAKEYRIIDNKTSEYADWTPELVTELKEFTNVAVVTEFFPNLDLADNFNMATAKDVTVEDLDKKGKKLANSFTEMYLAREDVMITLPCPNCGENLTLSWHELVNTYNKMVSQKNHEIDQKMSEN